MKCKLKKLTASQIEDFLLDDKFKLADLPQKYRIKHWHTLYILAFRVDRDISLKRYDEDLLLFSNDMPFITGTSNECEIFYNAQIEARKYAGT